MVNMCGMVMLSWVLRLTGAVPPVFIATMR
jgi:hypothetical protein